LSVSLAVVIPPSWFDGRRLRRLLNMRASRKLVA
jgi:hypothetical protein